MSPNTIRYPECRGAVFRPSYADDGSYDDIPSNSRLLSEPTQNLRLERVHGYHGSGFYPITDNNAYFLGDNHLTHGAKKSGGRAGRGETAGAGAGEGLHEGQNAGGQNRGNGDEFFEVVYPIAALVVMQRFRCDPGQASPSGGGETGGDEENEESRQRFFDGHDDDVTAIAVHPGGVVVASGQVRRRRYRSIRLQHIMGVICRRD